jgi:hypothetical protein
MEEDSGSVACVGYADDGVPVVPVEMSSVRDTLVGAMSVSRGSVSRLRFDVVAGLVG